MYQDTITNMFASQIALQLVLLHQLVLLLAALNKLVIYRTGRSVCSVLNLQITLMFLTFDRSLKL